MEIACKSCGEPAQVTSLLTAAQQPCPRCGKLLMGELGSSSLKAPPASFHEPVAPPPPHHDHGPHQPFNFMPLMIAALLGGILALVFAVLGKALDVSVQGMLLGMLAGVLAAPLIALGIFGAAMSSKLQGNAGFVPGVDEILAESVMDGLAKAVNERRYGKMGCVMLGFIVAGMLLGALLGSTAEHAVSPWLVGFAVAGGASLGALVGLVLTPYFPASPHEETKGEAEAP
jgi:MFS family permease